MMLADNSLAELGSCPVERRAGTGAVSQDMHHHTIPHGQSLYSPGAPRQSAYRVESGALCHYVVWPDGTHDVIEFAFPGDIVGLGSLGEYVSTAQAMVDTAVVVIGEKELEHALDNDAALAARLASATDREFEYLRRRALQPGVRPVPNRLAAYIIAVAGSACRSGETHLDADTSGEEALAGVLELPVASVRDGLRVLISRGLIAERDGAFVIQDFAGLEQLADA
jgi:CRP/FNR family transcriptional regulator